VEAFITKQVHLGHRPCSYSKAGTKDGKKSTTFNFSYKGIAF